MPAGVEGGGTVNMESKAAGRMPNLRPQHYQRETEPTISTLSRFADGSSVGVAARGRKAYCCACAEVVALVI